MQQNVTEKRLVAEKIVLSEMVVYWTKERVCRKRQVFPFSKTTKF